jgi:YbbR domain-containing protein
VDLAQYDMDHPAEAQALAVTVTSLKPGVQVLSWQPKTVPVRVDRVDTRDDIRVVVDRGTIPVGLEIGTPVVSDQTVSATGPHSQLVRVDRALAHVVIQPSGIDVRAQVELVPTGVDGQRVDFVELTPSSVTVSIDVSTMEATKTVPIHPNVTGTPAAGYEVGTVTVSPNVVTLRGAPDVLADITEVSTQAVSVQGATQRVTASPELSLPPDTTLAESQDSTPSVSVQVASPVVSRTFLLGLICQGAPAGTSCLPQLTQVAVTLRATEAALNSLDASALTPILNVGGLAPGTYDISVDVPPPPPGVDLISVSPVTARVVIVGPATPTPAPTPPVP